MAVPVAPESSPAPINSKKPVTPVKGSVTSAVLTWGVIVLIALALVAVVKSPASNVGIKDAASALVLISAAAVGIERILEVFWTFVDNTRGSFWPLTTIDEAINSLVSSITSQVEGPLHQLEAAVDTAKNTTGKLPSYLAGVPAEIQAIRDGIAQFQQLAPTSDRASMIADYTTGALNAVAAKYPAVKADVGIAVQSVSAISDFIDSLASNPGRRILSIYFGALMGLVVVLALGLDVFNAVLGSTTDVQIANLSVHLGVAATGLIIGLGSNPTHEVIKLLQTVKENQK